MKVLLWQSFSIRIKLKATPAPNSQMKTGHATSSGSFLSPYKIALSPRHIVWATNVILKFLVATFMKGTIKVNFNNRFYSPQYITNIFRSFFCQCATVILHLQHIPVRISHISIAMYGCSHHITQQSSTTDGVLKTCKRRVGVGKAREYEIMVPVLGSFFVCMKDYNHIRIRSFARILQCPHGICNRQLHQLGFLCVDRKIKLKKLCEYYLIVELNVSHRMYSIYFTFIILIAYLFLVENL